MIVLVVFGLFGLLVLAWCMLHIACVCACCVGHVFPVCCCCCLFSLQFVAPLFAAKYSDVIDLMCQQWSVQAALSELVT